MKQLTFRKCPKCGCAPAYQQALMLGGNDYVCAKGHNWPADETPAVDLRVVTSMEPT